MIGLMLAILTGLGCDKSPRVSYRLSDDQLALLMLDMELSEVAMTELPKEKQDSLKNLFRLRLTEIYKLTEPEIRAEIKKLEADPEKLKDILNKVKIIADSIR